MPKVNENIGDIIKNHKRIAVVGLSEKPDRPSHRVAKLMMHQGYEVIPVNPNYKKVLGEVCYPTLQDVPGDIDLVDIFRRPEHVDDVVEDAIEKGAKSVWLQLGIVNEDAANKALDAGLDVVMDRCWAIEYNEV